MEEIRETPIEKEQAEQKQKGDPANLQVSGIPHASDVPKGYVSLEQLAPFLDRLEEVEKLLNELVDLASGDEAEQVNRYLSKLKKTSTRTSARSWGLANSIRKLF